MKISKIKFSKNAKADKGDKTARGRRAAKAGAMKSRAHYKIVENTMRGYFNYSI